MEQPLNGSDTLEHEIRALDRAVVAAVLATDMPVLDQWDLNPSAQ